MEKHFCVFAYVFNPVSRKFLLVNHKKLGKWVQPGGHIEPNEDPEEAAVREVFEETGLNAELVGKKYPRKTDFIKPLALQKNGVNPSHVHMDFVYLAVPKNENLVFNEKETDGLGWFSVEEILNENFKTFEDVKFWCRKIERNN